MASLSLAKLFSSRSSNGSSLDSLNSFESLDSGESYVIALPPMHHSSSTRPTEPATSTLTTTTMPSNSGNAQPAEMLDDDNSAWGQPERQRSSKSGTRTGTRRFSRSS